jgi:hypothetical protein
MAYDPSAFEARRRGYLENFAAQQAMSGYKNMLSQQRGQRDLSLWKSQQEKQTPRYVAGFGRRGVAGPSVRSGIFANAMQEYAKERIRQQAEQERALQEQGYGYDLEQKQALARYNQNLLDLEAEKARQIEDDARQLLAMRSGF